MPASTDEKTNVEPEQKPVFKCPLEQLFRCCMTNEHVKEAHAHFRNSALEVLKGIRALIDARIEIIEKKSAAREDFKKIRVE